MDPPVTSHALERRKRQFKGGGGGSGQNSGPNIKNQKNPNGKGGPGKPNNPGQGQGGGFGGGGGGGHSYDSGFQVDELELTEREEKEIQENLTTWLAVMANVDKQLTLQLGHQFEDLILRCTIKSNNCTDPR